MTTATARKATLENKYLRNCDYSRLSCLFLFTFYNVGEVSYYWTGVRAVEFSLQRIKDLRFYAQVAIRTVNVVISCCCFARGRHGLVHECVLHVHHACFF